MTSLLRTVWCIDRDSGCPHQLSTSFELHEAKIGAPRIYCDDGKQLLGLQLKTEKCFYGGWKEDSSGWGRRFEVAVEAAPYREDSSFANYCPHAWVVLLLLSTSILIWLLPACLSCHSMFRNHANTFIHIPSEAHSIFDAEISQLAKEAFPSYWQNAPQRSGASVEIFEIYVIIRMRTKWLIS